MTNNENLQIKIADNMNKLFLANNKQFFSYAWRENVLNFLTNESKFCQLVEWINERVSNNFELINVFNPADKDEKYTKGFLKDYIDACKENGILINLKTILLDDKATTKMRENIEYTICKLFNLRYDNDLGYINN